MEVELKHRPSYSLAVVTLAANEQIKTEAGAMVSHTAGITTETKSEGGFFGGLKRMVGGESFFQNTWTAPASGGQINLASALPGDMTVLDIDSEFMLQSGAYIASEKGVETTTNWGGAKGFFGSGSLILLKLSGRGKVIIGCYGAIEERTLGPGEVYTIDTGHIVGFTGGMTFQVRKVGGWKSTFLSGEGLVCDLGGPGRLLMQTRSEEALINWIIPQVPQQSN
ncbi:TIGR00266 family protein [bacterium]|nr:TIGR00266 family protein [bacterium]